MENFMNFYTTTELLTDVEAKDRNGLKNTQLQKAHI